MGSNFVTFLIQTALFGIVNKGNKGNKRRIREKKSNNKERNEKKNRRKERKRKSKKEGKNEGKKERRATENREAIIYRMIRGHKFLLQ